MNRLLILLLILSMPVPAFAGDTDRQDGASSVDKHIKTGIHYLELGDNEVMKNINLLEKAADAFKAAIDIDPNSYEAHYYLGVTCLALDNLEAALREHQILTNLNGELAGTLLAKIDDYVPPASWTKIGVTGDKWVPPPTPSCGPGETFNSSMGACVKAGDSTPTDEVNQQFAPQRKEDPK